MKKQFAAFGLALLLLAMSLGSAGADGTIRDLSAANIQTTSAEVAWNCTYKEDQMYTLSYRPVGLERYTTRGTSSLYYHVNYLNPGTTYELVVSTPQGSSASITFLTPEAEPFARYGYQLLDAGLYKSPAGQRNYTALTSLNSKTLPGEIYDYTFSFMFQFSLTASKADKALDCLLVLTLPNGDVYSANQMFWYTLKSATLTQYFPFTDLLTDVLGDYGEFPTGEYTMSTYFDGGFAASVAFMVE